MNYLAHCCLVPPTAEALAGALLGDLIHGPDLSALPAEVARSVRLHRAIDRYTDNHPYVIAAKNLLQPPLRRYAGIIVDVAFDHLLSKDFARWHHEPLPSLAAKVYAAIAQYRELAPEATRGRLDYIVSQRLLERYENPLSIGRALMGIGSRLKRNNPLAEAGPVVLPLLPQWQERFERFYPELIGFAEEEWARLVQINR
ncbi:DUF479 domain-containing protein [Permianibacter sp. IMCC34836]|uniref:acyl carrier protein phosphodiesterase n=1 Tax=Permianibacter fluminis TaxID=2738515 RepID=UPI001556C3CD|nr:ACP phosphodiesterase [Permianibacter fluminis]NQD36847.1 DUF479 domain-containing protein [Permianibacter fluminis]